LISSSSIVYSEVLLEGVSLETCSDWNSFYSLFVTASISKQLLKFTLAYSDSLTSTPSEDTVVSCSRTESLALLQEFGVNGSTTAISCGANIWSIATCSGSLAVCVNCSNSGNNVSYVNIFSPCVANSSCFTAASVSDKTATVARVLIATFGVVVPAIVTVDVPVPSTSSVTVIVRLDQYGAAYCAAFFPSFTPTAVQQITSHRNSGWTVDNAVNVTLTSLAAATHYIVYCVTMSTKGQFSDISSALAARKLVKTSCCKLVTFSLVTKSVFTTLSVPKLATISVSSLPTSGLTVSLTAFHGNNTGNYSASIVFPATLAIAATSPLCSSVTYIGAVQTGNYRMVLTLSGDDADDFAVVYSNGNSLTITGEASTPLTPALNSAQFSEDGSFVVVGFDSQTDKGQVSNVNSFTCSLLMEFSGASLARCQWSVDATKITVTPSSSYPLSVGSEVRVMPNRIRAACPSIVSISTCKSWPATSNLSIVYLQAPASPKSPVVSLSLPSSIGSCDDLILDYGSSTGSGGRAWASINISLTSTTSANTSGLLLYVKSHTSTSNQIARGRIIIPNGLLSKGYFYAFTVRLCNFLGACGSSTSSVSVLNMAIPSVTIVGGSTFSTTANRSLSLASYAYTANCDGSKSVLYLQYTWSIFLLNGSSSTSLSLTSTSKDPSKYSLGAFALTPRYAYSMQVLVVNLVSLKSSAATSVVTVPQSDLIVVISGGSHLSLRLLNTFTVDASDSFDSDQSNKGKVGLQYSWRCYQTSPTYSGTCPLSLGLTNSSVVGGYANATSANTSSALLVSVYDVTRSASGEVIATVLSTTAPLVTILTQSTDDLLPTSSFTLTALVTASNANSYLECLWSVDDSSIDLYSLSYVSPIQVISVATVKTSSVYLSLGPNVLSAGATFTFSLACDAVTSDSASAASSSVASVAVTTNSPPALGVFSVSPLQGLELATTFSMSARFWVDADTPISYEFGFVSPSTGAVFVLQSNGLQSLASAYLPAGSSAVNSSLTTYVQVFDSLGASVLEYVSVQVASVGLNETNINSKTTSFMALVGGNVDGMKQVFSVVVNTLTAVNCSQAPNCSALNRFDCMATPHTCGSCISSSYVGINGDSNEKCVAISAFSVVDAGTTACEDDSDCGLWSTCDTSSRECVPALKSCSGNCTATENGHCKFVRTGNLQFLATCLVSDPSCEAICICSPGYYGEDCSADEVRLVANLDTTDTLAASLLNVKELETLDSQSAVFWANALQALTTNSIYLTTTSSSIAYNISLVLLQESSALTDATLTTLSAVVDNILGISTAASGRRRLMSSETAVNATAISSIMDTLAVVLTGQMVPNQQPQTSILSNYRIAAHVITPSTDTSTNFTVTAPVTSLESASNTTVSSMSVSNPNALFGDQTENSGVGIGLGLVSLPEYLIDMSSYLNSTVNASMTSNGFRLTLNSELQKADVTLAISSTTCNETSFTFSFAHYSAESFGAVGNATKILTTCTAGVTSTSNISCPSGDSAETFIVPVFCNGSLPTHTAVTTCPQLQRLPSCAVSTSAGTLSRCDVVNYTSVMTTCRCSGCLFTSTASASAASRKLTLTSSNAYSTGILALSVHSFTEYASVMESASAFNSVSALRDTILIVATFAVLWIGTLIAACSMQSTHSAAKKYVVQNNKSSSLKSVAPDTDEGVNNLPIKGTSRKSSLTADASLQPNSLEECLKEYIYELFSPAFSDETETVRFMRELWNKHEYFSVFAQEEFGTEQWISLFCLLTNLNANFFLLAFFYDIQFASDDGTCRLYASSAECESPKSMFNPAQSKCSWQVQTYSTDTYECVWQQPQIVIYTTIIVFLIALAVSAPITFAISCICEMVLMAPAVSEVEQKDAINKTRRQSAMLMMNTSEQTPNNMLTVAVSPEHAVRSPTTSRQLQNHKPSSPRRTVFTAVAEMDGGVKRVSARAHRLSGRQSALISNKQASSDPFARSNKRDSIRNYKSFIAMSKDLREYAQVLKSRQRSLLLAFTVKSADIPTAEQGTQSGIPSSLRHKELHADVDKSLVAIEDFMQFWGPFLEQQDRDDLDGKDDDNEEDFEASCRADSDDNDEDDEDEGDEENDDGEAVTRRRNKLPLVQKRKLSKKQLKKRSTSKHYRNQDDHEDENDGVNADEVENAESTNAMAAASVELGSVVNESISWIKRLKSQPPETIGVQLLELFVRDCLGQHSRQAIIFSQKVHPLKHKYILTWSIKCLTFVGLCILNLYFVFACMLYGKDKGLNWQRGWLSTCIVNIFVDVFINSVTVAAVLHFFVPNLIVDKARNIKHIVTDIVHDLCSANAQTNQQGRDIEPHAFSAAAYFFVSAHVARAFPDLLESRIVLAYKSLFLSKDQMFVINSNAFKELPAASLKHRRRTRLSSQFLTAVAGKTESTHTLSRVVAVFTMWTTTCLLVFGSQSLLGQEFIITMFNPGLVTVIAYMGLAIWNNSYFGMLVAVVILVIGLSVVYWCVHKMLERRSQAQKGKDGGHSNVNAVVPETVNVGTEPRVDSFDDDSDQDADNDAAPTRPPIQHRQAHFLEHVLLPSYKQTNLLVGDDEFDVDDEDDDDYDEESEDDEDNEDNEDEEFAVHHDDDEANNDGFFEESLSIQEVEITARGLQTPSIYGHGHGDAPPQYLSDDEEEDNPDE
jgi:membrane protein implicated in regulation of membrane protease activity